MPLTKVPEGPVTKSLVAFRRYMSLVLFKYTITPFSANNVIWLLVWLAIVNTSITFLSTYSYELLPGNGDITKKKERPRSKAFQ